jgi:hypothetical protein
MTSAAWLYGSLARGDSDADSDTDILVVTADNPTTLDVRSLIAPDRIPSISQYSWNEMVGMAAYGSLFLHHIRLEGRPLYEDDVVQGLLRLILDHLPAYQRASSDVKAFRLAIQDVRHSMSRGGSAVFEAPVLATVLRHSAILGCYVGGFPSFGRAEPVSRIVSAWKLNPAIAAGFLSLYQFRIRPPSRSASPQGLAPSEVLEWCDNVDSVLEALKENVDAYERGLQKGSRLGD